MGVVAYLDIGERPTFAGDVATNRGWGDLCRWADGLDGFSELADLCRHGWSEELPGLEGQLRAALGADPPEASVRQTAEGLLAILSDRKDAEVITIEDGTE